MPQSLQEQNSVSAIAFTDQHDVLVAKTPTPKKGKTVVVDKSSTDFKIGDRVQLPDGRLGVVSEMCDGRYGVDDDNGRYALFQLAELTALPSKPEDAPTDDQDELVAYNRDLFERFCRGEVVKYNLNTPADG